MSQESPGTERCEHPSEPPYNFVRRFFCSLPKGHEGEHIAYWNHSPEPSEFVHDPVAWTGPWQPDSGDHEANRG